MNAVPADHLNVVDLFAGCGGFTQGFHEFTPHDVDRPPFRVAGAVEMDLAAATTYAANFAAEAGGVRHIFAGDIKDWDPGDVHGDVDVILGGPPCQGFSGLGKEDPGDPRNQLWREYMKVVGRLQPKIFVIENVDRFFISSEYKALTAAAERGDLKDYVLESKRLFASDYGVPQARRRTIVLATHRDLVGLHPDRSPLKHPAPTHLDPKKIDASLFEGTDHLATWVPVSSVFGVKGRPLTPEYPSTTDLPDSRCDLLGKGMPGIFKTSDLHIGRNPTELSLLRYADIPPGGNRHNIYPERSTESWMNHRSGSHDVMGRMYIDRPSVTIRTEFYKPEKGRYLHPWADRPITHYEAALLQGFPEGFLWCGSKTQIARQIGNAVPVGLARVIARQVYDYLRVTGQVAAPPPRREARPPSSARS
ncbi:DNA cytosine methyltransferase [Sphaerisporangium corydalis]|uniref:Cytosine-specific methyltransferase n=1 Tax=Sphaerisporangium corydalis TaxID=1441875 RepID=A0ABV9EL93_9ACTN|nr:DNA cytosine methyltransferase [Sphaerisporangium corydalis]